MRTAATTAGRSPWSLLDRSMPDMDGLELQDAIVADPALDAPLVLMIGIEPGT